MNNILVLYNPYYNKNVIEEHLELLTENGIVGFGKIRSKLRDYAHPNEQSLQIIYEQTNKENPVQLFLTDYNNMYVANVIKVKNDIDDIVVPSYYNDLDIENWFIFDDLRLIAHKNFEIIRDEILSNFLAINFNGRTYALYGNEYVYPMQVEMKNKINYFEKDDEDFKFFTNIFKSERQIELKQNLIDFNFGNNFYKLTPNSQDNVISTELEYLENRNNPLYDFTSIVVKYSKAVEIELYLFMREVVKKLIEKDSNIANFPYSIQGRDFQLKDLINHKANYGSYVYLIKSYEIKDSIHKTIVNSFLKNFILNTIPFYIRTMQSIRNESVHGDCITFKECYYLRKDVLGIGQCGILNDLILHKKKLVNN